MAEKIASSVEDFVEAGGRLERVVSSTGRRGGLLGERFTTTERRVDKINECYRAQLSAMDVMVVQMNQTSAYLAEQFVGLEQQDKR